MYNIDFPQNIFIAICCSRTKYDDTNTHWIPSALCPTCMSYQSKKCFTSKCPVDYIDRAKNINIWFLLVFSENIELIGQQNFISDIFFISFEMQFI